MSKFTLEMMGTGAGLNSAGLGNTNALITTPNGMKVLIDCGPLTQSELDRTGRLGDIDVVIVTHLHSDHIGGIEMLGFHNYFVAKKKPILYVPDRYIDKIRDAVRGGMSDIYDPNTGEAIQVELDYYFQVVIYSELSFLEFDGLTFYSFWNPHVPNHSSMAFIIGHSVYWSSDTKGVIPELQDNQDEFQAIFHDCQLGFGKNRGEKDVHENLWVLGEKVHEKHRPKTWLMHYNINWEDPEIQEYVKEKQFAGFVKPGQVFTFDV